MRNSRVAVDSGITSSLEGDVSQFRGAGESLTHEVDAPVTAIPSHPLGVKPSGNAYTASSNARDATGPFQILPDEILFILLEYFQPDLLLRLGATCKFLYAFTRSEELWKTLFIEYALKFLITAPSSNILSFGRTSRDLRIQCGMWTYLEASVVGSPRRET